MISQFNPIVVKDVLKDIVDEMRETGVIASYSKSSSNVYTCVAANSLTENEVINIYQTGGIVNEDLRIYDVSASGFKFKYTGTAIVPKTYKSLAPYFMHGHRIEIANKLSERDQSQRFKWQKYPLIALFQDFEEKIGENLNHYTEVSLNMAICGSTQPDYYAENRYDVTFPSLYKLYKLLMVNIYLSRNFVLLDERLIPHTKIDRLYWGKESINGNTSNTFNDYIDAIELKNLKLKLKYSNCLTK